MAYTDPRLEARRKSIIAGTSNIQEPTISRPVTGYTNTSFEKRRAALRQGPAEVSLPSLIPTTTTTQEDKPGFFKKLGKVVGIGTGEWGELMKQDLPDVLQSKSGELPEAFTPKYIYESSKKVLAGIKGIINADAQRYANKEGQYRIDQSIPDHQALTYEQTIDFSSVGMLNLAKEDIQSDLNQLNIKESKSNLDKYRIKNTQSTIKEIDRILALPPDERGKNEVFINGLALSRISGNLASGFLGSLSGMGDFAKWRGDVSESQFLSKTGEVAADRLEQWAEAVAPDNPGLADELLQGAGSTMAFYIPGAGVSSVTAKLASISPRVASAFGITASAVLEASTESGNTYVEMIDAGYSREVADIRASRVFAGNVVFNIVSDKVGLFSDDTGVKKVLTTALSEGSQEAYQDGLQALAQNKDLDAKQLAKTFFIGSVVGGGMGSVIQQASVNEDLNKEDRDKLADLAEKIRQVQNGADPEMLGFEFVDSQKPIARFIDSKVFAESIGGEVGETVKIDEILDPEYAKGEIGRQQVDIVKEQIRGGDKINPIVVDKEGNVLDGAHRLVAFREMGVQSVDTVVREEGGIRQVIKPTDQVHDFSSTQLDLPSNVAAPILEFSESIPSSELATEEATGGRETEPHVTVLYGLNTTNEADVRGLVQSSGPIQVELGKVSIFENENFDVVKIDIVSDQLRALNKKIDDALDTPGKTFDDYKPHITIAYVKKGEGAKYVGDSEFEGRKINLSELTFSSKDGKMVKIPLSGIKAEKEVSKKADQAKKYTKDVNLADPSDFKMVSEMFNEERANKFKKNDYANLTKERVEEVLGANLVNEPKTVKSPKVIVKEEVKDILSKSKKVTTKKQIKVFHGGNKQFTDSLLEGKGFKPQAKREAGTGGNFYGLSTTTEEEVASDFSISSGGEATVVELTIKKGAKSLDLSTDGEFVDDYSEASLKELSNDYDIIVDKNNSGGESEIRVLNPEILEETTEDTRVIPKNKPEKVLHGTGVKFDKFSDDLRGSITGAKSAENAIWFTDDRATAKAYSIYAAEEGPVKKVLDEADKLEKIAKRSEKSSDWDKYYDKVNESEKLSEYAATLERRKEANVKEVLIDGDFNVVDAKGKTPQELSSDDNIDSWLNEQLRIAKKEGKSGVIFKNLDDAVGLYDNPATHYAVFSSKNIDVDTKVKKAKTRIKPKATPKVKPKSKSRLRSFPGVLSGLANKGVGKIHNFELRKPPKPGSNEFKLHKKVTDLIHKYAQTIGEGYTPRNALGVYFPKTKNIRINNRNNLTVAAHEIAHFLDYANNITDSLLNSKNKKIQKQIQDLYLQYYPTARESHQKRLQSLEGFAMLLQKYAEQPTTITKEYPDLVKEFLQPGGKYYHKVVGEITSDLNQIIGEYQGLKALDKIGASVSSEGTNINKSSFLNFWQKLRTQIADQVYPIEVLAQKGKVSFTKQDPSLWIRAYNGVSGIINNNISTDRGYWTFTDTQNGWQKKYDYNWKSLIESTQRRGITDSFANYLVARREYFMYQELDQLEAHKNEVEKIAKAFAKLDPKKMDEFNRDLRATLSEDYGIDLTEQSFAKAKIGIKQLFERVNKAYLEQKSILDKDGFLRDDVDAAYKENKKTFKDEETMFDALTREDLNLLYNSEVQLINKKTYTELTSKEGYASFKRQFYDEIVGDLDAPGAIRVGGTKVSSLIGRKGSERTIINPLFSAIANHSEIVRKSMKQVVYNQFGSLGASASMPNLMQVVPIQTSKNQATGAITFPQEKDNNIIMARRAYKRVPILVDGQVKAVIDSLLTHNNIDTFTQLYTGMSRMFTAGTTGLYPAFAINNFLVDQITATANSYNKFKGIYSPMKEMLKVLREKGSIEAKYYEEYLVMGGERQTFTGWQRLEPKDLFKRINAEKTKMEAVIGSMQKGVDILSIPAAKSEIFSRATEYINARKAGKSQIVSLEEAGRVTAPFHHIGAWGAKEGKKSFFQTYVRGLPFFNAAIQVLDQTTRVAATKQGRKNMTMVTIAITAAYLSAILAMMDASDDQKEQYKDLEGAELANFIYYPNPSGKGLIRVKMSNIFSIPGTVINMTIASKMFGAKYSPKDVLEASTAWLPDQFNPTDPTKMILGWIPQVFKPATHVIFNVKEYPTVKPLVNAGLSGKPAGLQYNQGTSIFAKKLGELMNLSPIKIDYLLTGYFGRASGFLTGKPGIYNPASSVMRDYYFTSGKRVSDFYKTRKKNEKEYSAYQNHEKGYTDKSKEEVTEIYRIKVIGDQVGDLISDYYDMDIEANQDKAAELRAKILVHISQLESGEKPRGFSKWVFGAKKRRIKNK